MRTGVSTASLFMRENNEEALSLLDALGVRTAEVFLTSFSEYDRKFGALLNEKKGRTNVHSVHVLNTQFEPQLFNGNPRVKKDAFSWLEKAMQTGQALGARYYTFHGIARIKRASRSGEKDDFSGWGRGLKEISELCACFGLELCLENVEWAMYNRPGFFRAVREYCPGLSCVLDIKQARISSYPYTMYLAEMKGSLAHVHVSDVDADGKIRLPGKGIFDFPEFLKRLDGAGFDGPLIIEVYKDDFLRAEELKQACDYLDELLYKYGFGD